ncbi:SDR family oxidoreductase [Burkholderia gladioli]|uniref:3-beta hydroxysteroid dehydrogenase/isomerase family protein n=1 Tax=Burkholderia gladioli TaxID=28095 RepID=A0AAW3F4Z2_BURGA|nr:SDR family oxidoreductase [Burkholderia gladioli]AJW96436.1 3-beta hydroxysteroid dehydrogenase/isomerase family protein [Burkholderia gladioli]ASD82824.1 NAD-dependent dehydratase [Burkholderia gladioli pv. gladioli]AWY50260.1 NAD-dependent dehydratase [Burkholderia gladioli pv. gladioli]KGC15031.1 3-beta hydroxysteroid dehydrogenase/isomerase family protein [Burkholderia gladioli]MBU9268969.1 SDR family oxidoreductase [Burkholderia gladioli]
MRIFLTGATGFIGSALVPELIQAGHQVLGMTRSEAGAQALRAAGAEAHHGTLEDPDSLSRGAAQADAVIHAAFDHDFSNFVANCEKDKRAIAALGSALNGSNRPLLITSGTGVGSGEHGEPASEDVFNTRHPNPRIGSEEAGNALLEAGVNVSVMRLPQVHNPYRQGLVSPLVAIARDKGVVAYVGEGNNRWPAGHLSDAVRLYRLAIEKAQPGARYHAVGEEGIRSREIAEVLGRGLKLPVVSIEPGEAAAHFGWMAMFVQLDMPASSALTQARLGWKPTGPTLIADLDEGKFAEQAWH